MFSFGITHLPSNNPQLLNDLQQACDRLEKKLSKLDFFKLNITDYNKKYLNQMIGTHDGLANTLRKYAFVLSWALHKHKNFKDITFLDYGAGHGLLGMVAAELKIKKTILSDIFPPSMADAKELSKALNLNIAHYIPGDTDDTIKYLKENNIEIDVISNYDTIEHIYDIEEFLSKLNQFGKSVTYFFASGANGNNPFIEKDLRATHLKFERYDKEIQKGHKASDSVQAYTTIRENIIKEQFDCFSEEELKELVRVTRGKRKDDILKIAQDYKETKNLPAEIPEKTDTCDPMNGNWAEHIMDPYELNKNLASKGFNNTLVLAGYYGKPKKFIKKMVGFFFNIYIKLMPTKLGLKLSPYYAIYGTKAN